MHNLNLFDLETFEVTQPFELTEPEPPKPKERLDVVTANRQTSIPACKPVFGEKTESEARFLIATKGDKAAWNFLIGEYFKPFQ